MSFIDNLPSMIENAEKAAYQGCGQSDVLYTSRVQDAYQAILDQAPNADYEKAEEMLRARGFDPDMEPYEAGEGECSLTGIDEYCCPCGRHP
jgi:hypothetical protein